jgi:hypothetical protein
LTPAGEQRTKDRKESNVVKRKAFLVVALACVAAAAPVSAQGTGAPAAGVSAQDRAVNEKILAALLERRAEVVAGRGPQEGKRDALRFLDRQIAGVKADLAAAGG